MKRVIFLLCAVLMLFSFTACNNGSDSDTTTTPPATTTEPPTTTTPEPSVMDGALSDILKELYATVDLPEDQKNRLGDEYMMSDVINSANMENYLGTASVPGFADGFASLPLMMPNAYLLCLVRVEEGTDIEAVKTLLKDNADPRRWICVGVDPANVLVAHNGNVAMLVMSDSMAHALVDAFLAL